MSRHILIVTKHRALQQYLTVHLTQARFKVSLLNINDETTHLILPREPLVFVFGPDMGRREVQFFQDITIRSRHTPTVFQIATFPTAKIGFETPTIHGVEKVFLPLDITAFKTKIGKAIFAAKFSQAPTVSVMNNPGPFDVLLVAQCPQKALHWKSILVPHQRLHIKVVLPQDFQATKVKENTVVIFERNDAVTPENKAIYIEVYDPTLGTTSKCANGSGIDAYLHEGFSKAAAITLIEQLLNQKPSKDRLSAADQIGVRSDRAIVKNGLYSREFSCAYLDKARQIGQKVELVVLSFRDQVPKDRLSGNRRGMCPYERLKPYLDNALAPDDLCAKLNGSQILIARAHRQDRLSLCLQNSVNFILNRHILPLWAHTGHQSPGITVDDYVMPRGDWRLPRSRTLGPKITSASALTAIQKNDRLARENDPPYDLTAA